MRKTDEKQRKKALNIFIGTFKKSQPDLMQSAAYSIYMQQEIMVVSGGTEINLQSSDNTVPSFTVVCDRYNSRVCYPLWLLRMEPTGGQRWSVHCEM